MEPSSAKLLRAVDPVERFVDYLKMLLRRTAPTTLSANWTAISSVS